MTSSFFNHDFKKAICEALGIDLTKRRVRKLVLTMEVNQPITLYIDEYAQFENGQPYLIANILELSSFSGAALPSEPTETRN